MYIYISHYIYHIIYTYIYIYIYIHYITLHYTTLHYTTLHYITLHTYIYTHTYIYINIYTYIYYCGNKSIHHSVTTFPQARCSTGHLPEEEPLRAFQELLEGFPQATWACRPMLVESCVKQLGIMYNIYICINAWMFGCMNVWMYECMNVCMYVYVYIYHGSNGSIPTLSNI